MPSLGLLLVAVAAIIFLPKAIAQLLGPIDMTGVVFCVIGVIIVLALMGQI